MHHHKHKPRKSERPKPPVCAGCGGPHPKNGICKGCGHVSRYANLGQWVKDDRELPSVSLPGGSLWRTPILSDEQREEID